MSVVNFLEFCGHFLEFSGHFHRTFCPKTLCRRTLWRTTISSNDHNCRMTILSNDHFVEWPFCRTDFSPKRLLSFIGELENIVKFVAEPDKKQLKKTDRTLDFYFRNVTSPMFTMHNVCAPNKGQWYSVSIFGLHLLIYVYSNDLLVTEFIFKILRFKTEKGRAQALFLKWSAFQYGS